MKVNTNDTDSLFEKGFTKYPFTSEKKLMSDNFDKSFSLLIGSPFFKKTVEVLAFYISAGSNSLQWHNPSRSSKQFCNFVLSANLSQ